MPNIEKCLHETGIIPVIKLKDASAALPLAEALLKGGLPAAEITFRTAAAAESIQAISTAMPDMLVCAGTVLTAEQAELAIQSGAKAVFSPGLNPEVVRYCVERGVPVYPGCATPSEIELAVRLGLPAVKLFPAEVVGGIGMLKALAGPYGDMKFIPTGGIQLSNVADYLRLPNVIACGGSWICPDRLLDSGDFAAIEALAAEAAALIKELHTV